MHQFLPTAFGLLQKYKSLLKKQLSREEYEKILVKLNLNHSLPRDEEGLYRLLTSVSKCIKNQIQTKATNIRFSGTALLLQNMEDLLNGYRLEKGQVVHVSQEASTAMVMAIQLILLPKTQRTKKWITQLKKYALKIAKHGMKEQQLIFENSLEKLVLQDELIFMPLLQRYQHYLQIYSDFKVYEESVS